MAEENLEADFSRTLDALRLTPEDRRLLAETPEWIQRLAVNMGHGEASALIKTLKRPGKMKFATMAPLGTVWAKYIREIPSIFQKKSGAIITIDAYTGLSLGNDPDYVRKMTSGALEAAGMTSWGLKYIDGELGVYELPFLFDTYGEADYVLTKSWPYFVEKFREKGFVLAPVHLEMGFLQLFSTQKLLRKPEDLAGTRYGSWMGAVEMSTMKRLGVNPIVITVSEVPSSLATNVMQTGSAMTMYMIGAQLMSFVNKGGGCSGVNMFYLPGGLVYTRQGIEAVAMKNLSKTDRPYLHKYINAAMAIFDAILIDQAPKLARELREANIRLIENMVEKGMQLHLPSKEEREVWKRATRPLWDELAGKHYSREILDLILKQKAIYRDAHPEEFETYVWKP